MVRSRFDNLDPHRQEAVLRAAAEEFAERGYEGASVSRIAERASMSKGSVYYYFDDKADLFATVVEAAVDRMAREIGWFTLESVEAGAFWDALLDLARRSVAYVRRSDWWILLVRAYQRLLSEAPAGAPVHRLAEVERRWWEIIVTRGQALGVIRDDAPRELLVAVASGADRAGDQWLAEHWDELDEAAMARIVDIRVDLMRDMLSKEHEGWE